MNIRWNDLSDRSKEYVKRYIRKSGDTIEQALRKAIIIEAIKEYENGSSERKIYG